MADDISIKLNCRDCGELVTWNEDVRDDDIISCKGCGKQFGTFGQIKALALDEAKSTFNQAVDNAIKGRPWVKRKS